MFSELTEEANSVVVELAHFLKGGIDLFNDSMWLMPEETDQMFYLVL